MDHHKIKEASKLILESENIFAFTGAGISVESGIPPFRGENGLWNKYDTQNLELNYFYNNPRSSWSVIKSIFYDFYRDAKFNRAHEVLAILEKNNLLKGVVTQNIDNLHQEAGSKIVHEFHGRLKKLICTQCHQYFDVNKEMLDDLPPKCKDCDGLLKPDFIFFGENISHEAYSKSLALAEEANLVIVVGTTGEVVPASHIPLVAKQNGARMIEVNLEPSKYTNLYTDIFLQGKASEVLDALVKWVMP